MPAYIMITGSIGANVGFHGESITIRVSSEIMKQIAREGIEWERDADWGYETPKGVPDVDLAKYSPRTYYTAEKYRELIDRLRGERRAWLAQFPGLDPAIPRAIES
jgi:phosphoenolpyruvate carboxykinase (ATP)